MNCRVMFENLADNGVLTASSQVATLPVAKLQDLQRTVIWQATGCAAEYVDIACADGGGYADALALINHNLNAAATLTLMAGSSPGASDIFSLTVDAWPPLFGAGEGSPGEHGAGGALGDDEIAQMYTDPTTLVYFDGDTAPFYRVLLEDPDNSAGFVKAGRLFLGPFLELPIQFDWGYRPGVQSLSKKTYSDGGQRWVDRKRFQRLVELPFTRLPTDILMWDMRRMQRLGYDGFLILDGKPGAPSALERQEMLIYGELVDTDSPTMQFENQGDQNLRVQELL